MFLLLLVGATPNQHSSTNSHGFNQIRWQCPDSTTTATTTTTHPRTDADNSTGPDARPRPGAWSHQGWVEGSTEA